MTATTARQAARREAMSLVSSKRSERIAREKRIDALAIAVTTAMVERRGLEDVIGAKLLEMTEVEGLQLRDAIEWCGLLTLAEAQRLHSSALADRKPSDD